MSGAQPEQAVQPEVVQPAPAREPVKVRPLANPITDRNRRPRGDEVYFDGDVGPFTSTGDLAEDEARLKDRFLSCGLGNSALEAHVLMQLREAYK